VEPVRTADWGAGPRTRGRDVGDPGTEAAVTTGG
jgi:hypothetical protein